MKSAHHRYVFPTLVLASILAAALVSCTTVEPPVRVDPYVEQTSEDNVLKNLQASYLNREIKEYAKFLADDFRFFFDEGTRQGTTLPVFWTRFDDSLQTGALFEAPAVTDIRITLRYGSPRSASEVGRENWTYIDVLDTFLEVDFAPEPGEPEGLTLRVDGQQQRFYFRKGRNAADTDTTTSETAKLYYLTEWVDFGFQAKPELASTNP